MFVIGCTFVFSLLGVDNLFSEILSWVFFVRPIRETVLWPKLSILQPDTVVTTFFLHFQNISVEASDKLLSEYTKHFLVPLGM